jgi:hypothetical protein
VAALSYLFSLSGISLLIPSGVLYSFILGSTAAMADSNVSNIFILLYVCTGVSGVVFLFYFSMS